MSGMPRPAVPFDARPLSEPVDRDAVRAYNQRLRASGAVSTTGTVIGIIVSVIAVVLAVSIISTVGSVFLSILASSGAPTPMVVLLSIVGAVFLIGIVALIVFVVMRLVRGGFGPQDRRYRLDGFARANGMSYIPTVPNPGLPGMIFGLGSSRKSLDLVRGTSPRFVEFANYRYTTQSGKNSTTHTWGYVAVKLDVPLPHIVLDALSNDGLFGSNLPMTFGKDQRLSLEGDFDRYFSLYCPQGYERDALYLFTPDIMVRFMDNAAALDVEIVDDWLFLYAKRDFSTLDAGMWAWLFSVVAALLDKLAQWERWRDDRLAAERMPQVARSVDPGTGAPVPFAAPTGVLRPPPGVAVPGRRLRRGIPWVAIIVAGVVLLMWFVPNVIGVLAAFFGGFGR